MCDMKGIYILLSLIPERGSPSSETSRTVRERGIPERINRTSLGAMMAWDPMHDEFRLLLLLLSRAVALRPNRVETSRRGLGRILRTPKPPQCLIEAMSWWSP